MNFGDIFKNSFFTSYANREITFRYALAAMGVCLLLAGLVCAVYTLRARRYFFSRDFAVAIVALSLITAAVILTIQSSIVVSLGMVGALSIVRFRTAVKNPLDLVFLFWSITVGIICGAGLFYIAAALTLLLGVVILLSENAPLLPKNRLLVMDMAYPYDRGALEAVLRSHVRRWSVKTESTGPAEVNLVVELRGLDDQGAFIAELRSLSGVQNVSVLVQESAVDG